MVKRCGRLAGELPVSDKLQFVARFAMVKLWNIKLTLVPSSFSFSRRFDKLKLIDIEKAFSKPKLKPNQSQSRKTLASPSDLLSSVPRADGFPAPIEYNANQIIGQIIED